MLTISGRQYADFSERARDGFEEKLTGFLEKRHPDLAAEALPNRLSDLSRALCDDALGFGIREGTAVAQYADLACLIGSGFPRRAEDAWALAILESPSIPPDDKVAALELALSEADSPGIRR